MLLRLGWFRKPQSKAASRRSRNANTVECLENRALLTASWNSFGGNAQHTEISQVAAQPVNQLLWSTSLDLNPWGAVHYGDPIFTPGNTVIVPVKVTYSGQVQGGNNFFVEGLNDVTGAVEWTSAVTGSITGATNASPIVITSPNNGLANGATVSIGGVGGNTAANGTFTITKIDNNTFSLNGTTGNGTYTSGGLWAYNPTTTSYIDPKYSWTPPYQPVYDPVTDRVYFPGPGGTLDYIAHPDSPGSSTPTVVQEAFYGTSNYTANTTAYNTSIYVNTGLTVDSAGNVYFGFAETGTNPSGINDGGIARITPAGVGSYVLAATAAGQTNDGNWTPALGSSPALSNDGSTLYLGINDAGYNLTGAAQYNGYLVGVNASTLAPEYSVHLLDPSSGLGAGVRSVSTASPVVAPDNTVFMGVFGNPYNGSRGFLLHFSGDLSTEYTPGAFGWDDSPSIVPASMVPSYTGSSSYLILAKYNNYANAEVGEPYGGNGVNKIAILDPYTSQLDPNYDSNPNLQVMKEVMTIASPSPDVPNQQAGDPDAVREWCTNGSVVDPTNDSVYVNNEDGYTYQWNLGSGLITNAVQVTSGIGVPYTPTAIGPNGEVFSDNGGTLFALGGHTNYTMNTVSSANPAIVGNSITLTTTLASTNSGPTPTGTVTFSYFEGANNPLNYNTTPVVIGTSNVVNGVATIPVSGLVAGHYHIYASYSGDGNYSAGQTIIVLPVLETVTTTVSSSANPVNAGTSVTLTASVAPNGTTFVPIGTVTFMDGSAVLGTVSLNSLDNSQNPSSTNTATFTTSALPGGIDAITAIYNGDQNFTTGTSAAFDEYIPVVTNPGTQSSDIGNTISLQVQAAGLPPGDSWTFSATGLPSGLSINTSTGNITGTITGSPNAYSVTVTAADGTKASASQSFTWNTWNASAAPIWGNFGGDPQHTDVSQVAAQPLNHLLWSTPLDLAPWGAVHYGDPVFTPGNTVIVPIKITWSGQNQNAQNFYVAGLNDVTGAVEWTSAVTGSVTGASNAGPIVITTGTTTGLVTGDSVTVGGVNGNTAANGTFTITVLNSTQFQLNGTTGNGAYTSGGTWAFNPNGASYIAPTYNWLAPLQPVYDPFSDRVYFPGPGGTLDYIAHPDNPGSSTPTVVQEAFYGLSNYTANESAYNSSIYTNTGLLVDRSGNVYFGFTETGTNPSGINDGGFVRISPSGVVTYTLAYAGVGQTNDGNWNPAIGQTPALSNDGSTVYFGVTDSGYSLNFNNESKSYLVALNSTTMVAQDSVRMLDPATGAGAVLIDESTASPMVAPDNTVFMGVFSSNSAYNGSRGFLLHYSANLQTEYTPGAFGWDDTPSIVPTSMVPSYTGSSSYLILSKYNNYANAEVGEPYGGNGVNQIAILDPYAAQLDPNYDANPNLQVMAQVMTMASPSPDIPNAEAGDPNAVREWCTNGTVVDPATDSVYVNNEDGYTYQWNLGTGLVTNAVQITSGIGVPYTPTAIAHNGEVYSDNGGTLFALGGYSNYTMSTVSSADPVVVGNTVTLTTTLASTNSGPTPTGTVTYTYFQGANNPLNYNTTPVTIGTANVVNGVASIQVSGLVASHYHIYASYSGDSNYSTGQTILVLPVLQTVQADIDVSANPVDAGTSVTFTAFVFPSASVANGGGTSFVPIGTVSFYDNGAFLGTESLNNLENETNPSTTNTTTFTTSALTGGTNVITAVYSGDYNFTTGTSSDFDVYVPAVVNPGTQNNAVGDAVSLQIQASGLSPGYSWTYSATGLPSGLSINAATGQITGTITGSATSYSVSVTAALGTQASATQDFTWNVATAATEISLAASAANPTYGQTETLTATVASDAGTPNAGTVTFFDGGTSLGTFPVSNGSAQFSTSTLTVGIHDLTATYSGDGGVTFAGSSTTLRPSSLIETIAGTGVGGFNGDGIPATSAEVNSPFGMAVDPAGDVFFIDFGNDRVREINHGTGLISTVAGTGVEGYNGDGIPATSAELQYPSAIALDAAGDLFIADRFNNRIREVNAKTGLISTVAGTGVGGYNGDGIAATSAELDEPYAIALDANGNIYIADFDNQRVREVNHSSGLISTVAGTGVRGYNGNNIAATSAELNFPNGVAVDSSGDVFVADENNLVREVSATTHLFTIVAGTGTGDYNGDGIPATSADLYLPGPLAVDAAGNLFILDGENQRIREVSAATGLISTVAGTGDSGYNGDGIPAVTADLNFPASVAIDTVGDVYIADFTNYRLREVESGAAIVDVNPLLVNPGTQNNAVGDTAVSLQVQASGLPAGDTWTYSATGLPSGLSINASTGLITGTITGTANAYSATVTVADGTKASASQPFTWNVSVLSETNPGTQTSGVGDVISLQIQDSGLPAGDSWSYSATGLPSGLSINASTGLISGTITGSPSTYSSSVTASDGHGASASQAFTWKVFFRPAITGPSSASVTENSSLTFSAANGNEISVTDQSAGGNSDSMTLSVSDGTITLGSTTGLTFTAGGNGTASFTVTGLIGNLNAALNGLTYTPTINYTGSDTLNVALSDPTDTLSTSTTVALTVNAITAPVITAPSTVTVSQNGSLVFSSGNGNLISFTDNGAGVNSDTMTLAVNHGTLTLSTTNGLIFTSGSNGSAGFTVKGTVSNLNAALAGMTYQPTNGYAGSDTLSLTVNDPTDSKSASTGVAINVSPLAPSITAPTSASMTENGSLVFSTGNGNSISLTDANPGSDSLTLTVSHGTLTLSTTSGLTFTAGSNGSASFTVSGTISNLNAGLNGLTYQPTAMYAGGDTLAISLVDPGDTLSASKNVALTINSLPAPTITAPATATVVENNALIFSSNAISVADAAAGGNSDSLSLSVSHGTLTLSTTSGLTFTAGANGSASFTVTGTITNLNAALNNLNYTPTANYVGSDSLAISITDPGDNESAAKSVAITVNAYAPPSISGPASASVPINGTLVFSSANSNPITTADSGPGSGSDSLQLSVSHGTVTLSTTSGLTITAGANGSATVTVTGSIASLNAALNGLTYKPTSGYTGADSLAMSINDTVDSLSGSRSVAITVNASSPPSISAPTSARAQIGFPVVFSTANGTGIVINDTSAGSNIQMLTVKATSGTLKLATTNGLTFISGANNSVSMTVEGTLANLNAALNGLSYTLAAKAATITLAYTDLGTNLSASANISVSSGTILGGGASPGSSGPSTVNAPNDVSSTTMPPDSLTQWAGVTAAVEMLMR